MKAISALNRILTEAPGLMSYRTISTALADGLIYALCLFS